MIDNNDSNFDDSGPDDAGPGGMQHNTDTPAATGTPADTAPNPFDPSTLRLKQNFAETVGVKKLLTTIPVRKPGKQDFIRVHPGPAYRLTPAAIVELQVEREVYLLSPKLADELPGEFVVATIFTAISRQGAMFLWPVKLPGPDGRTNEWHRSAAEAAERAMADWVRVTANMSLGAYEIFQATADLPEPEWPDLTMEQLLQVAFRDHFVDRTDHPLIHRLRGAA